MKTERQNLSLGEKGLTMSDATFLSNLCNQKSVDIDRMINNFRTYHSDMIASDGTRLSITTPNPIVSETFNNLILLKCGYVSLQAYLMEHVSEKQKMMNEVQNELFVYEDDELMPEHPGLEDLVDEKWAWRQLPKKEYSDFLISQAYASEIGKIIHKGGKLDESRREVYNLDLIGSRNIGNESYIVQHTLDSKSEDLESLHTKLAGLHRENERQVNYYKAKIKNMVSDTNVKIQERNNNVTAEFNRIYEIQNGLKTKKQIEFNTNKTKELQRIANLRIVVPQELQSLVNQLMKESGAAES